MGKILTGIRIPGKKSLSKTQNYSNFGLVFKWQKLVIASKIWPKFEIQTNGFQVSVFRALL